MSTKYNEIKDWLVKGYEYSESAQEAAKEIAEADEELEGILVNLFTAWLDNEDNQRLSYALYSHTDPEVYEEKLDLFIRQYIK